jgi:phenylpropionate dioxygenase-like ring-hydroxylating dioxygenase large terminal subunit
MTRLSQRYGRDPRVDPNAGADSPDRKFPDPVFSADILTDTGKYHTEAYQALEWDRLWSRTWNIAGRVSDLAKPGDWMQFELGPEAFIIVRTKSDQIKAFYNVCQHRGSRLVDTAFGHGAAFTCPFHSWSWNLDGSLRRITDSETFDPGVICDDPGLEEVRCDTWAGFIFLNMDPDADPLSDYLAELKPVMEGYNAEDMDVITDMETVWPVNWKILLDAFMEGYHAHARHPELLSLIDDYHFQNDLFRNGHSRMIIPMGVKSPRLGDQTSMTDAIAEMATSFGLNADDFEGRVNEVRDALPAAKKVWAERFQLNFNHFTPSQLSDDWNLHVFPNITFNAHPEGILVMRFRPHATDPAQCYYDVWVLARRLDDDDYRLPSYMPVFDPAALKPGAPRSERMYARYGETSFGVVLDQDGETVPLVQAGVRSRGFKGVRLSEQEIRLRHYYQTYDGYLGLDDEPPS